MKSYCGEQLASHLLQPIGTEASKRTKRSIISVSKDPNKRKLSTKMDPRSNNDEGNDDKKKSTSDMQSKGDKESKLQAREAGQRLLEEQLSPPNAAKLDAVSLVLNELDDIKSSDVDIDDSSSDIDKKDKAVPDVKQKQNVQRASDEASKRRVVKVAPGMLQESLSPVKIGHEDGPGKGDKDSNAWKNTGTASLASSASVTAASVRNNRARAKASSERDKKAKWGSREADRISRKERLRPVSSKDSSAKSERDEKAKWKGKVHSERSKARVPKGRHQTEDAVDEDADAKEKSKWKRDSYVLGASEEFQEISIQPGAVRVTAAKDSEINNNEDSEGFDLDEDKYAAKYYYTNKDKLNDEEAVSAAVIDEDALQEEFESKMKAQMVQAAEVDPYEEPGFCQKHAFKIGCCLFLIIISLVFGLLFGLREVEVTNSPTMSPTLRPDDVYLEELFFPISGVDLMDESTPQGQALSLMQEEAETAYNVRDKSNEELIERYAMRVFYFSTNGNFWTISKDDSTQNNFTSISNIPVCDWLPEKITCNERNEDSRMEMVNTCNKRNKVSRMEMVNANMNGTIPNEFGELTALTYLDFGDNNLHGQFPDTLNKLTEMSYMRFFNNSMSGTIPSAIGDFNKLTFLNLIFNKFTGTIPNNFWKKQHEVIRLDENSLNGTIPALKPQMALKELCLSFNAFTGTLPQNLGSQRNMELMRLNDNDLTGTIPEQLRALSNLIYLRLHENMLNGTIPQRLDKCTSLGTLYLHGNDLTGTLPTRLSKLDELNYLYLHNNNFSGTLPEEWGSGMDKLDKLDVSNNANLQGRVPGNLLSKNLNLLDITGTDITEGLECESPISAFVTADCGGTNPFVDCSCCTTCCDGDNCEVDLESICTSMITRWEGYGEENSRDNVCQCLQDSTQLSCSETCLSCSIDETSCVQSTNYGYNFTSNGSRGPFFNSFEYVTGMHTGTMIEYIRKPLENKVRNCEVFVNGTECECKYEACNEGSDELGVRVKCDDLEPTTNVWTCDEIDPNSYLQAFWFFDLGLVSGCELELGF